MMLSQGFSVTFSPLSSLQVGEQGTFYKLRDSEAADPSLSQIGLTLGMPITLVSRSPDLIIQVHGQQIPISPDLARQISIRLEPTCAIPTASASVSLNRLHPPLTLIWRPILQLLRKKPQSVA